MSGWTAGRARRWLACAGIVSVFVAGAPPASAEVRRLVVTARQDVLSGEYEKLSGTAELELDPAHPANASIVDLDRAPRNARGRVEASADVMVLRPRRPSGRGSPALLEVSNRGGKAVLPYFNRAAWSRDPVRDADFGDRLLMRLNLTVIWIGWQFDVLTEPDLLRLRAPVARDGGRPIEGLVRSDWTVDGPTATLPLAHRDHVAYPVADPQHPDNVLTVRSARLGPREIVPRDRWRFARLEGGRRVDDPRQIHLAGGFQPGKIYELVYRARDPVVIGVGLAAVRDIVSWARYDSRAAFPITSAIAFGVSQSGRFLRHFLYQGFNTDEAGRVVFDGMLVHTAGAGRGSFNHRFAQPSRDAHRFSAFFYPTDLFPFTGRTQSDPETGLADGLFARSADRPEHRPKIFFTNTGYEYWGRAASLIHTSVDGRTDVPPLPNERIYHLAGGQHFIGQFPPSTAERTGRAYRGNPLDFLVTLRALLVRLVEWVVDGRRPPASAYPSHGAGTLVSVSALRFPPIPDVTAPTVIHQARLKKFGPDAGTCCGMTFMMKTAFESFSQLRNAYTSVMSAVGSRATSGASRWLAASAVGTGPASIAATRSAAIPRNRHLLMVILHSGRPRYPSCAAITKEPRQRIRRRNQIAKCGRTPATHASPRRPRARCGLTSRPGNRCCSSSRTCITASA
jgi:hypothetical protein